MCDMLNVAHVVNEKVSTGEYRRKTGRSEGLR